MQNPEVPGQALAVAQWMAGPKAPKGSAHFYIDDRVIIQGVRLSDVAWGAAGANGNGLHLEHAGFAGQTPAQWGDEYSMKVLVNSARVAAAVCLLHDVPIVRLTPKWGAGLKGLRGFIGHNDVNTARGVRDHWDPGPNFPWDDYLARVSHIMASLKNEARRTIPD
jgi:hypothetical protein